MDINNKDLIIEQIPLFSGLPAKELRLVKQAANIVEYSKNQVIYNEGDPADALYCVVSGRVVTSTRDIDGRDVVIDYLHRGKYFGIISLLTGDNHSVTARALNDSVLLVIKKDDFESLLKKIPVLAVDLSKTLSRRIKDKSVHRKTIFESMILSVFSSYSQAGKTIYAMNLAIKLRRETNKSVVILNICANNAPHSLPQRLEVKQDYAVLDVSSSLSFNEEFKKDFIIKTGFDIDLICVNYNPEESYTVKRLLEVLSSLVNDYHYIVLDLPALMDQCILSILNQSDLIHILTSSHKVNLKKTNNLMTRLKEDYKFLPSRIKVVVNEYRLSKITYQQQRELLGADVYATLPKLKLGSSDLMVIDNPDAEYSRAIRRISRQLGDCLVGLALGVGVGYGFCHLGVLKVIEEEKIPVDVIVGSSIGSLIASFWAIGMSSDEILEISKREFRQPKYTWGLIDLTFPWLGFIKGNKFYKFLKKYLGNKTFYNIRLPLKIIASDIRQKEPKVLDKGLLIEAVMASCSMPGVFRPFKVKENILLDGGIINPLPTEVLSAMGVKKIIAVNVTPSREDIVRQYENIKEELASSRNILEKKTRLNLKEYFKNRFKTNILDIIFSSIEIMQSKMIKEEGQLADIVLHPDTTGLHWLELYRAAEFAKRGEEEARRNIDRIKQLVSE